MALPQLPTAPTLDGPWTRALFESLVESLPQNIFRKDRAGRLTFANRRYCETLKSTLPEVLGKTDFDLFPRELALKYVADDQRVADVWQRQEGRIEERNDRESWRPKALCNGKNPRDYFLKEFCNVMHRLKHAIMARR